MIIIGITGGTGAGKTTALGVLTEFGAEIIDCDALYHELLKSDEELLSEIGNRFHGVVKDGVLDRKKLGTIVFRDEKALSDLNVITHACVYKAIENKIKDFERSGVPVTAIDAIALFESGLGGLCDFTVGVIAEPEIRINRIMQRENISEEYAKLRVSAQKPNSYFSRQCDYVLENNYRSKDEFAVACRRFFEDKLGGRHERA